MIDLRVVRPTLVEAAERGGATEMREKTDTAHTASLTQVEVFTPSIPGPRDIIHRAEINYSEVKLYFAQDGHV